MLGLVLGCPVSARVVSYAGLLGILCWQAGCAIDDREFGAMMGPPAPFGPGVSGGLGVAPIEAFPNGNGGTPPSNGGVAGNTGGSTSSPPAGEGGTSSAGAGGSVAAPPLEPGDELAALVVTNGEVLPGSNPYGIYGSVYVIQSPNDAAPSVTYVDDAVCLSGVARAVPADGAGNYDYANAWGVYVGLSLAASSGGLALPWAKVEGRATGFSFVVEGAVMPSDFRFAAVSGSDGAVSYCVLLGQPASAQRVEVPFEEMRTECWLPGGTRATEPTLQSLSWQIQPNVSSDDPFDLCISDIKPIFPE